MNFCCGKHCLNISCSNSRGKRRIGEISERSRFREVTELSFDRVSSLTFSGGSGPLFRRFRRRIRGICRPRISIGLPSFPRCVIGLKMPSPSLSMSRSRAWWISMEVLMRLKSFSLGNPTPRSHSVISPSLNGVEDMDSEQSGMAVVSIMNCGL